jgi:hypothetical protein
MRVSSAGGYSRAQIVCRCALHRSAGHCCLEGEEVTKKLFLRTHAVIEKNATLEIVDLEIRAAGIDPLVLLINARIG